MFESVRTRFTDTFGDAHGVEVTMAPGRVNLIGEYTDFNDGFVFPMTVDRGAYVAMRPRADQRVSIVSVRYEEHIEYALDQIPKVVPGHWSCYVLGIIEELRKLNLVTG
ncbi:MAG: galactokinase, partial [Luminiphilus sp.]|nr:galactokinase [Luminiphilus sp.]